MREILFRGKTKKDGKWIYGYLVKHDNYVIVDKSLGSIGCGSQVIPETIGQFTGLLDANGTKIFEGDVVTESTKRILRSNKNYLVEWVEASCGFEPFSDSLENCGHCGGGQMPEWMVVVGNIHDNPELIKEEK